MIRSDRGIDDALIRDRSRLQEISELDLFAPEVASILESVVDRAAIRLGLPVSLVSIVLDEAQYFAAFHGLEDWLRETRGTPVEWAFCARAVSAGEPFVVEDATTDPAVRDNPLVTQDGIRCYAGIPLVTRNGHAIGTLCVIGTEPRAFTADELRDLHLLAAEAMQRIEQRRAPSQRAP